MACYERHIVRMDFGAKAETERYITSSQCGGGGRSERGERMRDVASKKKIRAQKRIFPTDPVFGSGMTSVTCTLLFWTHFLSLFVVAVSVVVFIPACSNQEYFFISRIDSRLLYFLFLSS